MAVHRRRGGVRVRDQDDRVPAGLVHVIQQIAHVQAGCRIVEDPRADVVAAADEVAPPAGVRHRNAGTSSDVFATGRVFVTGRVFTTGRVTTGRFLAAGRVSVDGPAVAAEHGVQRVQLVVAEVLGERSAVDPPGRAGQREQGQIAAHRVGKLGDGCGRDDGALAVTG